MAVIWNIGLLLLEYSRASTGKVVCLLEGILLFHFYTFIQNANNKTSDNNSSEPFRYKGRNILGQQGR